MKQKGKKDPKSLLQRRKRKVDKNAINCRFIVQRKLYRIYN